RSADSAAHVQPVDENGTGKEVERDVYIQHTQPVVIRPPLVGRGWLAAEGASNFTGHRRTPIPIDAQPYFAQRYAVDWIQYGENGLPVHGPAERNESWFCYGAEVLAVADGVITMTQDGIIENVALEKPAIEITLQSAPGNLIIQEIGDGRFAFYAHLIPGSLTVKEGDRVRAGQVIARLGNSGNSDAPHLHFHIGSRNSPLGAQGLPYHFAAFQRAGYAGSTDEVMRRLTAGEAWQSDQAPEWRENEMFASNDVINLE
ncbi:MAG: M23 family metallopeptidase, partial [Anaerolineaceae bacterium]